MFGDMEDALPEELPESAGVSSGRAAGRKWHLISAHRFLAERWVQGFLMSLCFVLPLLALGVAIPFFDRQPGTAWIAGLGSGLLCGTALLIAALMIRWYRGRIALVRLYNEGVKWERFRRTHKYPWEDVVDIYRHDQGAVRVNEEQASRGREIVREIGYGERWVRLAFRDGVEVTFDLQLQKFGELLEYIVKATSSVLYPVYRAALDRDVADFGPVRLTRDTLTVEYTGEIIGLKTYAKVIPWSPSIKLRVVRGSLSCEDGGKTVIGVKLAEIANYEVLLRLLQERGWRVC
jgi:hypothetical protein